jgi:hypothetical protein
MTPGPNSSQCKAVVSGSDRKQTHHIIRCIGSSPISLYHFFGPLNAMENSAFLSYPSQMTR